MGADKIIKSTTQKISVGLVIGKYDVKNSISSAKIRNYYQLSVVNYQLFRTFALEIV